MFPLEADEQRTKAAWRHFVDTGELRPELLRAPIFRAWRRCKEQGASPHLMVARTLSPEETDALLRRERDLLEAARPYMQSLSRAAGDERHAAMLGDRHGIVLDVVGDEPSVHGPERVPGAGALLSEQVAGANGLGSPLAEGGYVELIGPEHFIQGFHIFTCQGLPLRGPDGDVVGVLGISVRRLQAAERVHEILVCAAHGIEAELIRRRLEADVRMILQDQGEDRAHLERLRQDIVQLQAAARLRLERAARSVGKASAADTLRLLQAADELIRQFRCRSERWREVATDDLGTPQPLSLDERVRELIDLLKTEAAVQGLTLGAGALEPLRADVDPRQLSRQLLRVLLRAIHSRPRGARIEVGLVRADDGQALLRLSLTDPEQTSSVPLAGAQAAASR